MAFREFARFCVSVAGTSVGRLITASQQGNDVLAAGASGAGSPPHYDAARRTREREISTPAAALTREGVKPLHGIRGTICGSKRNTPSLKPPTASQRETSGPSAPKAVNNPLRFLMSLGEAKSKVRLLTNKATSIMDGDLYDYMKSWHRDTSTMYGYKER